MPATVVVDRTREEIRDAIHESIQDEFVERGISDDRLVERLAEIATGAVEAAGVQFLRMGLPSYANQR